MSRPPEDAGVLGVHPHNGKRTDQHAQIAIADSVLRVAIVVVLALLFGCGAARQTPATPSFPPPSEWWWQTTFVNSAPPPGTLSAHDGGVIVVGNTLSGDFVESGSGRLCAARLQPSDGTPVARRCLRDVHDVQAPVLLTRVPGALLLVQDDIAWRLDPLTLDVVWETTLSDQATAAQADPEYLAVVGQGGSLQILSVATGEPLPTPVEAMGLVATRATRIWGWALGRDPWGRPQLDVWTLEAGRLRSRWQAPVVTDAPESLRTLLVATSGWLADGAFTETGARSLASGARNEGVCPVETTQASGPLRWSTERVQGRLLQMQRVTVCPTGGDAWTTTLVVGFPIQDVSLTPDGSLVAAQTQQGWALLDPSSGALLDWLRPPQVSGFELTSRVDRDASLCSIVALHAHWGVLQCILWNGVAYEAVPRERDPTQPAAPAQRRVR